MPKAIMVGAVALLGLSAAATAQISGDVVKIGVLTDQSGNFSSLSGAGSVLAAEMAVADYGGRVGGQPHPGVHTPPPKKTQIRVAQLPSPVRFQGRAHTHALAQPPTLPPRP